MARRKGFLAEMQRQARLAEQRQRAAAREHAAAVRRAEQLAKAEQRAAIQLERANEADRKRLEKAARDAHVATQQAEADKLNAALTAVYDGLDNLLSATLDVDDYVDLNDLRQVAEHPPFADTHLEIPTPVPTEIVDPEPPVFQSPAPPSGLFGRKKKMAAAQEAAETMYAADYARWEEEVNELPRLRQEQDKRYQATEKLRLQALEEAKARYASECQAREVAVAEHNEWLDQFIVNLSYGDVDAIQEYVGMVLANSVYPVDFEVNYVPNFAPESAELNLQVLIPSPDQIPSVKSYRYVKSSDEISATALSQKDAKERYAGIIHQVALRTLHEIFEADRRNIIQSISVDLGTNTINPATGKATYIPFCAVAASRDDFDEIDLSAITPSATLDHLGASVSKNPLALTPANGSGVRRS